MVTQKAIALKIDFDTLEELDDYVRDSIYYTNRNREINQAIQFYLEYKTAKFLYNNMGEPRRMREFAKKYIGTSTAELFKE